MSAVEISSIFGGASTENGDKAVYIYVHLVVFPFFCFVLFCFVLFVYLTVVYTIQGAFENPLFGIA